MTFSAIEILANFSGEIHHWTILKKTISRTIFWTRVRVKFLLFRDFWYFCFFHDFPWPQIFPWLSMTVETLIYCFFFSTVRYQNGMKNISSVYNYLSTQINPWIYLQEIIENSAKYFSTISEAKFIEKNISFESITAIICVIYDDLSCFSPILWQKYTRLRCASQNSPILDFQAIQELFNVKCRSHH